MTPRAHNIRYNKPYCIEFDTQRQVFQLKNREYSALGSTAEKHFETLKEVVFLYDDQSCPRDTKSLRAYHNKLDLELMKLRGYKNISPTINVA